MQAEADPDASQAIALLIQLHRVKNVGYGDAWRKRGELLSIFTNLARKYDRLVVALDDGTQAGDERLLDTAGDLCVYAGKYLTWLADQHPAKFEEASTLAAAACRDDGDSEPLAHVLESLEFADDLTRAAAWLRLKSEFERLDEALTAQAEGEDQIGWDEKVRLAWAVAESSASLLVALCREDPQAASAWRAEIEAMQ